MAAGLCALSLALLFGGFGEPVATADSETADSISDTEGAISGTDIPGGANEQVGAAETEPTEPTGGTVGTGILDTIPEILGAVAGTDSHSESEPVETHIHEEPAGLTEPMALGGSTGVPTDDEAGNAVTASDLGNTVVAAYDDSNGSDSTPAAATEEPNEPEVVVSHSPVTEPSPEPEAPDSGVTPLANDPPVEEPAAVQPVTSAAPSGDAPAESVQAEAAPPVGGVAPPVGGVAPPKDVITALAYFFIALANHNVPFIEMPGDLLSLLGFPVTGDAATASMPAGGIGGSLLSGGLYSAARTQLASSRAVSAGWPEMLIAGGDSAALSSAGLAAHPTPEGVGASGVVEQHSVGIKAVLADGIVPEQVRSVLQYTVDAVLAPLSVLALAAMASPGVVGLLLLSAAGMFVGYRQARAASMLRSVGIARFAKSGPLGVVRSGSLIAVHPRPSRSVRRQPSRSQGVLEPVA